MALLWVDGFDWIEEGTTSSTLSIILGKRYPYRSLTTGNDAIIRADPFGVGRVLALRDSGQYIETPALVPSEASETWIVGFRVRSFAGVLLPSKSILYFLNSDRENAGRLRTYESGHLLFSTGVDSIVSHTRMVSEGWYWAFYFEIKVYVHDTAGTVEIRVNGNQILYGSGLDTRFSSPAGIDRVRLYSWCTTGSTAGRGFYLDDIYICQGTGIDFLGQVRIPHLVPDGDGDDEQWSLSSGTDSYALVDENEPVDGDSQYIYDDVTGQRTLFTYEAVPTGLGSNIKGVQLHTGTRVDGSALDLKQQVKSGGTLYPRAAQNISSGSFIQIRDLMETDPDTAAAWTESGLNAAQFGAEVG